MKRYCLDNATHMGFEEHPNGAWVRWEDATAEIERLEAKVNEQASVIIDIGHERLEAEEEIKRLHGIILDVVFGSDPIAFERFGALIAKDKLDASDAAKGAGDA